MMSPIRIFSVALLTSMIFVVSASGGETQTKIDLQAALLNFLETSSDQQGRFRVIDRNSGEVVNVHAG